MKKQHQKSEREIGTKEETEKTNKGQCKRFKWIIFNYPHQTRPAPLEHLISPPPSFPSSCPAWAKDQSQNGAGDAIAFTISASKDIGCAGAGHHFVILGCAARDACGHRRNRLMPIWSLFCHILRTSLNSLNHTCMQQRV